METQMLGLLVGGLFGAALFLGGLADPDKIIGTLRLKDFHAMRTITVFVIVGMLGFWVLQLAGVANTDNVKPANLVAVLVGGALLGIGFGLTGYCPGTGLACAAAGRLDALVTVIGMFFGALAFILLYSLMVEPLDKMMQYDKVTLPEYTSTARGVWVVPIVVGCTLLLYVTRGNKKQLGTKP